MDSSLLVYTCIALSYVTDMNGLSNDAFASLITFKFTYYDNYKFKLFDAILHVYSGFAFSSWAVITLK